MNVLEQKSDVQLRLSVGKASLNYQLGWKAVTCHWGYQILSPDRAGLSHGDIPRVDLDSVYCC